MSSADILSINMFCTCLSPNPTTYPTMEKSGESQVKLITHYNGLIGTHQ